MEKETYTKEEVSELINKSIAHDRLIERYLTFHTVSMQRSIQMGDPQEWRDAAEAILRVIMAPPAAPAEAKPDAQQEDEDPSGN